MCLCGREGRDHPTERQSAGTQVLCTTCSIWMHATASLDALHDVQTTLPAEQPQGFDSLSKDCDSFCWRKPARPANWYSQLDLTMLDEADALHHMPTTSTRGPVAYTVTALCVPYTYISIMLTRAHTITRYALPNPPALSLR